MEIIHSTRSGALAARTGSDLLADRVHQMQLACATLMLERQSSSMALRVPDVCVQCARLRATSMRLRLRLRLRERDEAPQVRPTGASALCVCIAPRWAPQRQPSSPVCVLPAPAPAGTTTATEAEAQQRRPRAKWSASTGQVLNALFVQPQAEWI